MSAAPRIRSLLRETALYGIPGVVSRSMGLLLLPVLTNVLPPDRFGNLKLTYVLIGPILLFMVFGMGTSLVRHLIGAEDKESVFSTHFWPLFTVSTLLAALTALAAGPIAHSYFSKSLPGDEMLIRLAAIILWFDAMTTLPYSLLRAENRPWLYLAGMLSSTLVYAVLVVLLLGKLGWDVEGVLVANAAGSATSFVLFLPVFKRYLRLRFDRATFAIYFAFGFPIIFSSLGKTILDLADRLILDRLQGPEVVGYYSAGYQIGALSNLAVAAFTMAWKPFLVRVSTEPDSERTYARVMTFSLVLLCWMTVATSLLAGEIVSLKFFGFSLVGERYWQGMIVVPAVMASYIFYGAYVNLSVGCDLMKKTHYYAWTTGAAAALNVAACFVLIPDYGMMGAAWATLVAYVFQAALLYWLSQRIYPIRYEWGRIIRLGLLSLGFYWLAKLSGAGLSLRMALIGLYSLSLFAFRVLDRHALRSILPLPRR